MKLNLTRARPEDIKPGFEYWVRSSDLGSWRVTYARRIVEPRIMIGDMIRAGLSARQAPYLRDETMTEFENRLRSLRQMCREGIILVREGEE